jgi:hypothetical protein
MPLDLWFNAFSDDEPVPTSWENALAGTSVCPGTSRRRGDENQGFAGGEAPADKKAPERRSGALPYLVIRRFWIEPAIVLNTAFN